MGQRNNNNDRNVEFWRQVTARAGPHLGRGVAADRGRQRLLTVTGAALDLGPLWAEAEALATDGWGDLIDAHLRRAAYAIEEVSELDTGLWAPDDRRWRLRFERRRPNTVGLRVDRRWQLGLVVDLDTAVIPATRTMVAEAELADLLRAARVTTVDDAEPRSHHIDIEPGLTLVTAGPYTSGCVWDLHRLVSLDHGEGALVLILGDAVLLVATHHIADGPARLRDVASMLTAAQGHSPQVRRRHDTTIWRFLSPGEFAMFEAEPLRS